MDREWPGGLCDIATLGPCLPPTLSWASLTRNGQLLDLKLQVDRGVLIRFGSSGLETHGSLQTWELLGASPKREKRRKLWWKLHLGRLSSLCSYDLLGVSQKRMLLVPVNYLGVLNHIPLVELAFPQDRKERCRAPAISNMGYSNLLCILLPW